VHRLFAPSLLILFSSAAIAAGALRIEHSTAGGADVDKQVSRIVAGILSYARWPAPPETYRFCVTAEARYLGDAQNNLSRALARPVSVRRLAAQDANWAAGCDVLYIGEGGPPGRRHQLLNEAIGKPVLTISEGDDECVDPSMFCLAVQGKEIDLLANLDAISRSSIRISPKVLQLMRRKQDAE